MPRTDAEEISIETHELDYVLKKWNKTQSEDNRAVLVLFIGKFKNSEGSHDREAFYKYSDMSGLKNRLLEGQ